MWETKLHLFLARLVEQCCSLCTTITGMVPSHSPRKYEWHQTRKNFTPSPAMDIWVVSYAYTHLHSYVRVSYHSYTRLHSFYCRLWYSNLHCRRRCCRRPKTSQSPRTPCPIKVEPSYSPKHIYQLTTHKQPPPLCPRTRPRLHGCTVQLT